MGAFKANEDMDHYGGQGSAGFFSLKDDKDTARVRFMYSGIEDVQGYAVHEVKSVIITNTKANATAINLFIFIPPI